MEDVSGEKRSLNYPTSCMDTGFLNFIPPPLVFVACFSLDCDGYGLIGVLGFGWSVAGGCRCLYREQLCDLVYWL